MRALCDSYLTRKKETFRKRQVEVSLHFELSARQRGDSGWAALRSALGLVCVAEEEDTGPDEEFEECLLIDSEVLLLHFPRASFSSDRLLLHLSNC